MTRKRYDRAERERRAATLFLRVRADYAKTFTGGVVKMTAQHQRNMKRDLGLSDATVTAAIDRWESWGWVKRSRGDIVFLPLPKGSFEVVPTDALRMATARVRCACAQWFTLHDLQFCTSDGNNAVGQYWNPVDDSDEAMLLEVREALRNEAREKVEALDTGELLPTLATEDDPFIIRAIKERVIFEAGMS